MNPSSPTELPCIGWLDTTYRNHIFFISVCFDLPRLSPSSVPLFILFFSFLFALIYLYVISPSSCSCCCFIFTSFLLTPLSPFPIPRFLYVPYSLLSPPSRSLLHSALSLLLLLPTSTPIHISAREHHQIKRRHYSASPRSALSHNGGT